MELPVRTKSLQRVKVILILLEQPSLVLKQLGWC